MSIRELKNGSGVYVRDFTTHLHVHEIPRNSQYTRPHVIELDTHTKTTFLETLADHVTEGQRIMQVLEVLDHKNSLRFGLKKTAIENLQFRLLQHGSDVDSFESAEKGFIILSYACHSSSWTPHPAIVPNADSQDGNDGPLMPAMWMAFLSQRLDSQECFWVDQLCIDQSSEVEKSVAIGSMDLLYSSARKVIVAIEDVALSSTELAIMLSFTRSGRLTREHSEEDLEAMACAFIKLAKARWFRRAWCLHEFLVSKNHVFLVPVSQDAIEEGPLEPTALTKILRIDGPFLVLLYHIFIEQHFKDRNKGVESLNNTQSLDGLEIERIRRFFTRLRVLELSEVFSSNTPLVDGSYMHMYMEIFSHDAMFNSDKLAILLNTMNSGLYLKGVKSLNEEQCCLLTTLVALAAGDATVLASNGKRIPCSADPENGKMDWARMPALGDQARRIGALSIPRTIFNVNLTLSGLQLDMVFIATSEELVLPLKKYLSTARWLIDHRHQCPISTIEDELRLDLETDGDVYSNLRLLYIETLACVLQCGKAWMVDCYASSYISLPNGISMQWEGSSKQTFEDAIDWALDTNPEPDIGSDMEETWEDHLEQGDFQGEPAEATSTHKIESEEGQNDCRFSPEEQVWYCFILEFTDRVVNFGLALFQESDDELPRKVHICNLPDSPPFLAFAPPSKPFDLCIPKALIDESYCWMTRMWMLERCDAAASSDRYRLLCKTRFFGSAPVPQGREGRITVVGC